MPRIDRTERLLNLVICLMASSSPSPRARIHSDVNGYSDAASEAAFERMFERDKDELRSMGIPIDTVFDLNGEVLGYRIDRANYRLDSQDWTVAERTALALAARSWARATSDLTGSLAAAKVESMQVPDELPPPVSITAASAALLPLMRALRRGQVVDFEYQSAAADVPESRRVSPWGLTLVHGHWYLVGHDHHRGERRTFRVSRVCGGVSEVPDVALVSAPAEFDPTDPVSLPEDPEAWATVRVRLGRGASLRQLDITIEGSDGDWDVLTVRARSRSELIAGILAAGSDALVTEPPDVRASVRDALSRIVDQHHHRNIS